MSQNRYEHFLSFFDRPNQTDCWNWKGMRRNGYGRFWSVPKKRFLTAHRIAYTLRYGAIPEGLCVCHHCDNRSCVNPRHLFVGTHLDNSRDKYRKGRGVLGRPNLKSRGKRGKITVEDVRAIRELIRLGLTYRRIGELFGISQATVADIKTGRVYGYVRS